MFVTSAKLIGYVVVSSTHYWNKIPNECLRIMASLINNKILRQQSQQPGSDKTHRQLNMNVIFTRPAFHLLWSKKVHNSSDRQFPEIYRERCKDYGEQETQERWIYSRKRNVVLSDAYSGVYRNEEMKTQDLIGPIFHKLYPLLWNHLSIHTKFSSWIRVFTRFFRPRH